MAISDIPLLLVVRTAIILRLLVFVHAHNRGACQLESVVHCNAMQCTCLQAPFC